MSEIAAPEAQKKEHAPILNDMKAHPLKSNPTFGHDLDFNLTREQRASVPPITTKFKLGEVITEEQLAFLEVYGFLHFKNVLSPDEVETMLSEAGRIEAEHLEKGVKKVNGVPIMWGVRPNGKDCAYRLPFTSEYSEGIKTIITDSRFEPLLPLVGDDARIGHREKDGVVINRYINEPGPGRPRLGWHTDGLRDLFYGRMPQKMLNFGLHLTDCPKEQGGLRLIPGTHKQSFWQFCTHKIYFLSHDNDANQIEVEAEAGDLTVHDGRLWHRVERSTFCGDESIRRSLFLPIQTGPYEPKDENSAVPKYLYLERMGTWVKRKFFEIVNR